MIYIDSLIKNGRANQDYVFAPKGKFLDINGDEFCCTVVFDGHGDEDCINKIREAGQNGKLLEIMRTAVDPATEMFEYTNNCKGGATMNAFRVYNRLIQNFNIGDSHAIVYKIVDTKAISKKESQDHSFDESEIERLKTQPHFLRVGQDKNKIDITHVSNDNTLQLDQLVQYVTFTSDPLKELHMTQSLGHYGDTGCDPSFFEIDTDPAFSYRCIHGSDGIWDVLGNTDKLTRLPTYTCQEIMELTDKRYAQTWAITSSVYPEYDGEKYTYPADKIDDRCVAIIDIDIRTDQKKPTEDYKVVGKNTDGSFTLFNGVTYITIAALSAAAAYAKLNGWWGTKLKKGSKETKTRYRQKRKGGMVSKRMKK
jgi:serine/threonine protein phosphatase PrpC